MTKNGKGRYATARGYYQDAYRQAIRSLKREWTGPQITSTLAWMWKYATEKERTACEDLLKIKSTENTFEADAIKVPTEVKNATSPAPSEVATTTGAGGTDAVQQPTAGGAGPDAQPDPGAIGAAGAARATQKDPARALIEPAAGQVGSTQGNTRVNTTAFNHMPLSRKDTHSALPQLKEGELTQAHKRTLLEADIGYSVSEGKKWRGAHFLGAGATGACTLWVKVDDNDNIEERVAVRDVGAVHQRRWVDPTNWRDRLPREIAIMKRLHDQGGAAHNIYRYFGHRIDMYQRRYRIYTEVCDFGNIKDVLEHYSRVWRRRRNKYKWNNWVERQHEVEDAKANVDGMPADDLEISVRDTKQEIVQACKAVSLEEHARSEKDSERAEDPRTEFGDMSDIEDWFDQEVERDLPEVIPEAFLWHVFDQLVDAALIMQRGGEPFKPLQSREKWREIVHKDLHPGNIFVKPPKEGFMGKDGQPDDRNPEKRSFAAFPKDRYPDVVLADIDTSIFDLQDDGDEYQDNPLHYMMASRPTDAAASRYPPEAFFSNQNMSQPTKFTSASDVWGIGAIMWNLAMNIPHNHDYIAPFYDNDGSHRPNTTVNYLNHGTWYSKSVLDHLMTGATPFEAAGQYSKALRGAIRSCLPYEQRQRIKLEKLKKITQKNRELHMSREGSADLIVRIKGEMQGFQVGQTFRGLPSVIGEDED